MAEGTKRYVVVTGANKGIGFAICKQLASNGINVVLTARDEKRGLESVEKLKELDLPGHMVFHQLDVTDSASIGSFADFIRTQYGKLDILVNNAGIPGAHVDGEALAAAGVVNIPNGWPKEELSDVENLTEEKIEYILNEFLKDFKEGSLETKGWPISMSAYSVSKVALNAYTRILARKYPSFCINAVCPGYVKTDINYNTGTLTPDEGAEAAVRLALLPHGSPSGLFFHRSEEKSF
ncbi:(+)-neomenthol dehydrogenase-like isoform X3 [Gastrolobium bilobum]|uniref:(+)-neomenthol dehydrogenase-like isoform X3 n=1 Tax=Gastrolobium bilobum TaxID=150636 RepID=UPI002AB2527E|nr:(+)-neomenthol dehydrogenase-like isoform X3 [Gastrolobium bilobum]